MKLLAIVPYYFVWHYTLGIMGFFKIWGNLIVFLYNFFSFKVILRTLFAPYKRLSENYKGGLDIEKLLESIIINTVMRIVGLIARAFVLFAGVVAMIGILLGGVAAFIIWLLLPFIILFIIIAGFVSVFDNKGT